MAFTGTNQAQDTGAPASPSSPDKNFLYQREAGVWIYLIQAFVVMVFVFVGALLIGGKMGWLDLFFDAALIAWVMGIAYFIFSLWRWNKLSWLENKLNVNLDRDPRIGNDDGKRPTMYIRIQYADGQARTADSKLPVKGKRYLVQVAQAVVNNRPFSQRAMKQAYRMSRPNHEKVMAVYEALGILRKEDPLVANSPYVIAEPVAQKRAVLQAVALGNFQMLEDVWASKA